MRLSNGFDASASALTAQRLRMDVISSNIANAETTRGKVVNGQFEPYARKLTVMEQIRPSFADTLKREIDGGSKSQGGVKVSQIMEDRTPPKLVYNPSHPDADAEGYVKLPNVDISRKW